KDSQRLIKCSGTAACVVCRSDGTCLSGGYRLFGIRRSSTPAGGLYTLYNDRLFTGIGKFKHMLGARPFRQRTEIMIGLVKLYRLRGSRLGGSRSRRMVVTVVMPMMPCILCHQRSRRKKNN